MILVLTPTIIIYNLICVTVLVVHSTKESESLRKDIIVGLTRNPLIIACVLGLVWNFAGIPMSEEGGFIQDL